jgi:serine/threonine protein kinase
LLFGDTNYTAAIDVWAVGCVFAEMLIRAPLFRGQSDIDQLRTILTLLGTPSQTNWPAAETLPDFNKIVFEPMHPTDFAAAFPPSTSKGALQLLERMLALDPARRISAADALCDPYFWEEPLPCMFIPRTCKFLQETNLSEAGALAGTEAS